MWWTSDLYINKKGVNNGEKVIQLDEGDRYRIYRKESIESYRNLKVRKSKCEKMKYNQFIKCNVEKLIDCNSKLDTFEKAFLLSIIPYIGYEDCCLKYPNNGILIKFDSLIKISGISKGKLSKVINSLIEKNILYKENAIKYFVNPYLFYKGHQIEINTKRYFKEEREELEIWL